MKSEYIPLIQSGITATAVLVAALIAAYLSVRTYRQQKNLDRKQEEYRSYVATFEEANFWNGKGDRQKHKEAEAKYHQARVGLLLVASEDVIDAAATFHNCYVSPTPLQEKKEELFNTFAAMIAAMRKDGFDKAITTPEEVKKRIPWEA